ncbi:hypothetical protein ACFW1A_16025 [Kitasatospora sp. NPDC058965]|uniref:hypothetical protein n=1 Tax=Kitasatospora sp. NPDC058965 TaxID=3346682 RepID=UPI0036C18464
MIRAITFHIVTCDVCGDEDSDDPMPLYDTHERAAADARHAGWIVTADQRVICPVNDREHRAAVDRLMPPEPRIEIEGQQSLDLGTDTSR